MFGSQEWLLRIMLPSRSSSSNGPTKRSSPIWTSAGPRPGHNALQFLTCEDMSALHTDNFSLADRSVSEIGEVGQVSA
jgi:hypothetical protein